MTQEKMTDVKASGENYIINTYNRKPETPLFLKGQGAYVEDEAGRCYLDFLSGLGVNNVGHCHPDVVQAVTQQAALLMHTSNLYYTKPQVELAQLLVENTALDKVFFCNSGAEANEAAIKLARKYYQGRGSYRYEVISFARSFHGRTLATISVTGQEKTQKGFAPLMEGVHFAQFNNLASVKALVSDKTCAILVEPIQGEGGVYPAQMEFLTGLRRLCTEMDILLIFDEVQCGLGRTGKLFAYENYGVVPDILTSAKALGGGLPLGAMLAREAVAAAFLPGDHASTFGGNPVACAAGCAVLRVLLKGALKNGGLRGESLKAKLMQIKSPLITEVRGLGLMLGVEVKEKGEEIYLGLLQEGILCNLIAGKTLRILPPLIITEEMEDKFIEVFINILKKYSTQRG